MAFGNSIWGVCLLMLFPFQGTASGLNSVSTDTLKAHQQYKKAQHLQDQGAFEQATPLLETAAANFLADNYYERAAECYNEISFNYRSLSRFEKAKAAARNALETARKSKKPLNPSVIYAYYNLAKAEAQLTRYQVSDSLFRKALELAHNEQAGSNPGVKSSVLSGLGSLYDDQGKYDRALKYYQEAIHLLDVSGEKHRRQLVDLYNYIGVTYAKTGKYELALEFYNKQQEINFELYGKDHPDIAGVYNNIGAIYYRQGDIGEAINYFKKAVSTLISVFGKNHPGVALVYNNIGECYLELTRHEEAVSYLRKSVKIKEEIRGPDHPDVAVTYNNIGQAYMEMDNLERAREYIRKALQIRKNKLSPGHPHLAETYHSLGKLHLGLNEPKKALTYFELEISTTKKSLGQGHPRVARAYGNLSIAHRQLENYDLALRNIQQALVLISSGFEDDGRENTPPAIQYRYPETAMELLIIKAQTLHHYYRYSGNVMYLETALETYSASSDLMDRLQIEYQNAQSKLLLARRNHELSEKAIQTAFALFNETGNRTYLHQIYLFAEKSKSRVIREQMKSEKAKQFAGIPDAMVEYEKQLRTSLAEIRKKLNGTLAERDVENQHIGTLRDSVFALNQELNRHLEILKKRYPRYHRFMYNPAIPAISGIQQKLESNNSTIIEYFYGDHFLWAIIIDKNQLDVKKLDYKENLSEQISRFNQAIYDKNTPEYLGSARELYNTLLAPLRDRILTENLLIVPDGALNLLPFETLLEQPVKSSPDSVEYSDLPYLAYSYSISYAPAVSMASAYTVNRTSTRDYDAELAAFAPVFAFSTREGTTRDFMKGPDNWGPLPASEYEVRKIAGLMDSDVGIIDWIFGRKRSPEIFIGETATERTFKRFTSGNYRYLHLATHAYVTDSLGSGISFHPDPTENEDGLLYDYEIYNLSLTSELVVLSACETGAGRIVRGEGIIGLSRAFQYAGAQNLLVSLWNVDDRSTARLMVRFYEELLDGTGKSDALRQSKLNLIKGKEFAHPRYWAPFVLIGK